VADDEQRLSGVAGSHGIAIGTVYRLVDVEVPASGTGGPAEQARSLAALQAVAARLGAASERLQAAGRTDEAEILATGQLMADDPSLLAEVEALAANRPAVAALIEATERQAARLAAIPDPYLSARAADVRRLGRQAARLASGIQPGAAREVDATREAGARPCAPTVDDPGGAHGLAPTDIEPVILVASDLGPADLAEVELSGLIIGGIALAEGAVTSHAAIVARSLGVPLVVGLGEGVLDADDGMTAMLDGMSGALVMSPTDATLQAARAAVARQEEQREQLARSRADGAATADGHRVRLLMNASTERDMLAGLQAGAEGIGLLRTELAFLDALDWPTRAQHEAAVRPIFRQCQGRTVTVRTLDFGADKTPPFLRGRSERGIALQLAAPDALVVQLRALLHAWAEAGTEAGLRIMLPLAESPEQIAAARAALELAHREVRADAPLPSLGAMIESRRAVEQIEAIAAAADFLSIGTNDLVQDLLGLDRLTPAATIRSAADPRVLRAIRTVTGAAHPHGLTVEVCGEAAGDPEIAVLLVGLGVTELSVAPSRLDIVRAAVRAGTLGRATELAEIAIAAETDGQSPA
jgi:phosphoenolpyruvate-protein kinase (PTS system EI component)